MPGCLQTLVREVHMHVCDLCQGVIGHAYGLAATTSSFFPLMDAIHP